MLPPPATSLIIRAVTRRRANVRQLHAGVIELPEGEAHHLRDVLRMKAGDVVELFDDSGAVAEGQIVECSANRVAVTVIAQASQPQVGVPITVASAVPKGERAEWMIEKLSELGVSRFVPLATARSVVLPEGKNKRDRWARIAIEAAKQSRRSGVMQIESLTKLHDAIAMARDTAAAFVLATEAGARPLVELVKSQMAKLHAGVVLFIGPEGGWTNEELAACAAGGLTSAKLTATILRVETAAVAAAAIVAASSI
jgi:16S rRNA (uracil1498-N3)-methyltransferase